MPEPREPRELRPGFVLPAPVSEIRVVERRYEPWTPPSWMPSISRNAILRSTLALALLAGASLGEAYGKGPSVPNLPLIGRVPSGFRPEPPPQPLEKQTPLREREKSAVAALESDLASFLDLKLVGFDRIRPILDREHIDLYNNELSIDFDGVTRNRGGVSVSPDILRTVINGERVTEVRVGRDGLLRSGQSQILSETQMLALRRRVIVGDRVWEVDRNDHLLTMTTQPEIQPDGKQVEVLFDASGRIRKTSKR